MKLLILSDSHGNTAHLAAALDEHRDAAAAIYLGDGVRDIEWLEDAYPDLKIYIVRGNCDSTFFYPTEGMAPFGGLNIFYTHGHVYNVKSEIETLAYVATARGADIALYGHTHRAAIEQREKLLLFNPGSISDYQGNRSYGVITIVDGKADAKIWIL